MVLNDHRGHALRTAFGIMMLVLLLADNAGATTITVNASGGANYTRIQDAVNTASNGDMITVAAGTYNENVDVNKSVSLIGAGSEFTIVNASNAGKHVFNVIVNNVNISGFKITGAKSIGKAGISLNHSNNNNISSNNVSNNYYGIELTEYSNYNRIYNNFFKNINNYQIADYPDNNWNITKSSGTNIIGGPYLGGNFWAYPNGTGFSQTCADANKDGICDSPYALYANNTDYLPLTIPAGYSYIYGSVLNNNTGIADVTVATNTSINTRTDASGRYSLLGPAGTYNLTATSEPGFYPNSSVAITVVSGVTISQDIDLLNKPTGNITGSVNHTRPTNGWNLVWSDEFDGISLDTTKWGAMDADIEPEIGNTCEKPSNLAISGGIATFILSRTTTICNDYNTNPPTTVSHDYRGAGIYNYGPDVVNGNVLSQGRWETRARFPKGTGITAYILLWPADDIWSAEVDFAEALGSNTNVMTFTQHWNGVPGPDQTMEASYNVNITQWHTYAVEMENGQLKWYVDEQLIITQPQRFAIRSMGFSAAIWAGNCNASWPGCPTGTELPTYLDMDYVRVYSRS